MNTVGANGSAALAAAIPGAVLLPSGQIAIPQKKSDISGDEIALISATGLLGVGVGAASVYALSKRGSRTVVPAPPDPKQAVTIANEAEVRQNLNAFPLCVQPASGDNRCGYYAALTMTKGRALRGEHWDKTLNRYVGMVEQYAQHFPLREGPTPLTDAERRDRQFRESLRPSEIALVHNAMRAEIDSANAARDIYYVPMGANAYRSPVTAENIALDFDDVMHHFASSEELTAVLNGDRRTVAERLMFNDRAFLVGDTNRVVPSFTVSTARATAAGDEPLNERPALPANASVDQRELPVHETPYQLLNHVVQSQNGRPVLDYSSRLPEPVRFPLNPETTSHGHAITLTYENGGWNARDPLRSEQGPIRLLDCEHTPQSARDAIHALMFGNGQRFGQLNIPSGSRDVARMQLIVPRLEERPKLLEQTLTELPPGQRKIAPLHFFVAR